MRVPGVVFATEDLMGKAVEDRAIEQVANVARADSVLDAWARGQPLAVHGWIYDLSDGLLRDMKITISRNC